MSFLKRKAFSDYATKIVYDTYLELNHFRDETGGKVDIEKLDLASLRSVRNCAQRMIENEDKIDILINNAGIKHFEKYKRPQKLKE